MFQATEEAKKPQTSAAKIANKGNIIVLDGGDCDSYISNKASRQKIPVYQENNVYVMDVGFMTAIVDSSDEPQVPFRMQV